MEDITVINTLLNIMNEPGTLNDIVPGVNLFRVDKSRCRCQINYDPSIIIMIQGKKKVFIGDEEIIYDPTNYLVSSVHMPVECETVVPDNGPLIGIRLSVDAAMVSEIAMTMEPLPLAAKETPLGLYSSKLTSSMNDAVKRLILSLNSPLERQFLAPIYIREIIFRVLCDDNGTALRMLAYRTQGYFRIVKLIEKIHSEYDKKFDVNSLAREVNMSVSAFHAAFKSITNSSPMQYIKKEKLHKARELILSENLPANTAAYRVGYESPSQFSREYKRMFGETPGSTHIPNELRHAI